MGEIGWKEFLGGLSVPILIFSFVYFNFFGMPFLPSLWQLGFFVSNLFAHYFWVFLVIAVVVYGVLSFERLRTFFSSHLLWVLVATFVVGLLAVTGNQYLETLQWLQNVSMAVLVLAFSLAIAVSVLTFSRAQMPLWEKSGLFFIVLVLFAISSKSYIVDYISFPIVDDHQIRIWSSEDTDYVYSCDKPKGSLYEIKFEKADDGGLRPSRGERRFFRDDATERLCKRLFPDANGG